MAAAMLSPDDPLPAIDAAPSPADQLRLADLLYEFNVTRTGHDDGRRYGIYLRDAEGGIIGGADGWTWGGTCYVTTLYLPEELRRRGTGSRLMAAIEAEARLRSCDRIVLRTHDFQAPAFYAKLGFAVVASVDYPQAHRELTLVKRFQ